MTEVLLPIAIGLVYVLLSSLIPEPHRRKFNALMAAGAGAAYQSGGELGMWELVFCAAMALVAFRGLDSWTFIGIGWLLHTAWDVVHHIKGAPILPFAADSSLGCALTDPVIALWAFTGGRSRWAWPRRKAPAAATPAVSD
ncbi:DUF6010 family protein [Amycolatopsis sp. NPDC023774]|uniref:DUF6010 family protein n=1 Tax=Amycolatopsis sp. NPDC023774 TaxID=3155015 RepID=UPI0033E94A5F